MFFVYAESDLRAKLSRRRAGRDGQSQNEAKWRLQLVLYAGRASAIHIHILHSVHALAHAHKHASWRAQAAERAAHNKSDHAPKHASRGHFVFRFVRVLETFDDVQLAHVHMHCNTHSFCLNFSKISNLQRFTIYPSSPSLVRLENRDRARFDVTSTDHASRNQQQLTKKRRASKNKAAAAFAVVSDRVYAFWFDEHARGNRKREKHLICMSTCRGTGVGTAVPVQLCPPFLIACVGVSGGPCALTCNTFTLPCGSPTCSTQLRIFL